jgi:tocopherol cyclase
MLLQTPHSGFHWDGQQYPFFEGWYYRLTIPPDRIADGQTIAFMYSFQAPVSGLSSGKKQFGGCTVQVLGPEEQYFCRSLPNLSRFWASKDKLEHGYSDDRTNRSISESYKVTTNSHEGEFWNPSSSQIIRWSYTVETIYGWGTPKYPQQSTAGWLSQFQIFEPGWQILMAHGFATGWFEKVDRLGNHNRLNFERVPTYAEKNWGGAFPKQWFWIQCNAFESRPDLALTCGGGIRKVLGWQESVGMVGIHYQGQFYEFVPWNSKISWQVKPWGSWQIWSEQQDYAIELIGKTSEAGVMVRVPNASGLEFFCRDTTSGNLQVNFWKIQGKSKKLIFTANSNQAGLEIGGDWTEAWHH